MWIKSYLLVIIFYSGYLHPLQSQQKTGFLYDYNKLIETRKLYQKGAEPYFLLVSDLIMKADRLLTIEPPSVVNKKHIAPSGNKHDYYSIGPYWWPNPDSLNGLPYIRHDGKKNPEYDEYDRPKNTIMTDAVFDLSLAYFYTEKEKYARKATEILSVWFIHPDTRMNPHLEYGQAIPGRVDGRGIGIIETGSFLKVINALEFLKKSDTFLELDLSAIKIWFDDYLNWLLSSEKGWDERRWHNNHGSSYDSQVATYSMFVGKDSVAQIILDSVKAKRIDRQIEVDGSQPWELERTKSMSYSLKNLLHLMENAILAEKYEIDLWNYESTDGRSIKKAVKFIIPYMKNEKDWPYVQYGGILDKMDSFKEAVWIASLFLDDELIDQTAALLFNDQNRLQFLLLYPDLK